VETHARGFIEGAWNGPFDAFDLARATVICGTGAVADHDRVRFHAATDQHGVLFSLRAQDSLYVSNSPAFALAAAGEEPHPIYPFYQHDLVRIYRQGLHCPDGRLRLSSARVLHVHYTTIVSVDRSCNARYDSHPAGDAPGNFRSYESTLRAGVREVLANAADAHRRHRYAALPMLSRGYDSTAITVLARDAGAVDTFTYVDSRHRERDRDSGVENARSLGMTCTEYDRWQYLDLARPVEVEFGYGPLSSHASLAAVEDQLAGRLLMVGQNGDQIWNPQRARVFERLSRPWSRYTAGLTDLEYRLRVGYPIFAPACIGARHNRAMHEIGVSDEMRPWSVGGPYDRPVPRRIGEEAGLARDAFGRAKAATSHSHLNDASRFSSAGLGQYRAFMNEHHAGVPLRERHRWQARARWRERIWEMVRPRQRYVPSSRLQRRLPFLLNAPPIELPWEFMFTFQWTCAALRERYRVPAGLRPHAS
jgi:hypothetical protein